MREGGREREGYTNTPLERHIVYIYIIFYRWEGGLLPLSASGAACNILLPLPSWRRRQGEGEGEGEKEIMCGGAEKDRERKRKRGQRLITLTL